MSQKIYDLNLMSSKIVEIGLGHTVGSVFNQFEKPFLAIRLTLRTIVQPSSTRACMND